MSLLIKLGERIHNLRLLQAPGVYHTLVKQSRNMTVGTGGDGDEHVPQFSYEIPYLRRGPARGNHAWAALHLSSAQLLLPSTVQLESLLWRRIWNKNGKFAATATWKGTQEEAGAMTSLQDPGGLAPSFKLSLGWVPHHDQELLHQYFLNRSHHYLSLHALLWDAWIRLSICPTGAWPGRKNLSG